MRWMLMSLAVMLAFAVQSMVPADAILAQDEAEPSAEKAEAKPLWDDGSRTGKYLKKMQGLDDIFDKYELTQDHIDELIKHCQNFTPARRKNGFAKLASEGAANSFNLTVKADWYTKWAAENKLKNPSAWLAISLKVSLMMRIGGLIDGTSGAISSNRKLLENAEPLKDISAKEYAEAKKQLDDEVAVLNAQKKALEELPSGSKVEKELLATNTKAIEEAFRGPSATKQPAANDLSQMILDSMTVAAYIVLIHEDPEIGQYWETEMEMYGKAISTTRWQVVSVDGDTAIIENLNKSDAEYGSWEYVIAYEIDLSVEDGKANVTKAWKGLPGEAGTELEIMEEVTPEEDDESPEIETEEEDFTDLELAGVKFSGKIVSTDTAGNTSKVWTADNGWFNKMVKMEINDMTMELVEIGDDCEPLLKWQ